MRFATKQVLFIFTSSLVLSSVMYSLSVSPLHYALNIGRNVGNKLYNQINKYTVKDNCATSKCEVVHIGIVCAGYKYSVYLHTMLKSLYFYRINPIHFHIMVDDGSKKVLKILFETWDVPQVAITFYDINNFLPDVDWIPKITHYSGRFGLLKLLFPKAIPLSVTNRIIIMDIDLTFNDDIYELWNLFKEFNEHQAIGVAEHQNDYYLGNLHEKYPWPAIGRGFNSGVMLYHLERLTYVNWDDLWRSIAKETLATMKMEFPDQDIINTVLSKTPSLLYNIPCQWNIQLSDYTDSYKCYDNNKVKIVHWNSQQKSSVGNKDGDYFRRIYTTFVEYNGNLLRYQLYNCSPTIKREVNKSRDICDQYQQSQNLKRRTLLFVREFKHTSNQNDVTFVSQLSREKIKLVEELSKRWDGPISLTLYVTDSELHDCLNFIEKSEVLQKRHNIAYHVVFKEGDYYPINDLRNIALRNVATPYVFLVDLDLLPMKGLYVELQNSIKRTKDMEKMALVVPAFESPKIIAQNKKELLKLLGNQKVFPFHYINAPQGHNQTNFEKWKRAKTPYYVQWAPYFEPYIIVKRNVVEYDPTFVGFGWNKVSHIMELVGQKYKFLVLPNAFLVHKNHPDSNDLEKFKYSATFHTCVTNKMKMFVERVNRAYGTKFDTKTVT